MVVTQDVHRYGHHLARAIEYTHGVIGVDDLQPMVDAGKLVVWANDKAAIAAEPHKLPDGRWGLTVSLAGGDMDAVLDLYAECEEAARSLGAAEMRAVGREGWERVLKSRGFRFQALLLSKALT
jgi:hypothetical protein